MRERPSSTAASAVVWGESLTAYNFGEQHPMHPSRLDLTARLVTEFGLFDRAGVRRVEPEVASDVELGTVHDADYIDAVRRVSDDPTVPDEERGLGTMDDPAFAGMHEASARIAGRTRAVSAPTATSAAPGRVDSPPMSRMSAPCPASARP